MWSSRETSTKLFGAKSCEGWTRGVTSSSSTSSFLQRFCSCWGGRGGYVSPLPEISCPPGTGTRAEKAGSPLRCSVSSGGPRPKWGSRGKASLYLDAFNGLPKGEAGTVMALRVDVSQDSNEERGRVSLPEKLPSARLAKLQKEASPLGPPPVLPGALLPLPGASRPTAERASLLCPGEVFCPGGKRRPAPRGATPPSLPAGPLPSNPPRLASSPKRGGEPAQGIAAQPTELLWKDTPTGGGTKDL